MKNHRKIDGLLIINTQIQSTKHEELHEANRRERDDNNDFNGAENTHFQKQKHVSDAVGKDLWKLLNRVFISAFNGNKVLMVLMVFNGTSIGKQLLWQAWFKL